MTVRATATLAAFTLVTSALWSCQSSDGGLAARSTALQNTPATMPPAARPDVNPIPGENAKAGDSRWRITNPAVYGEIAGYTGATSYDVGETVDFHVSTRADGVPYSADIYRMGWYGGTGARRMASVAGLTGKAQGYWTPGEGLRDCARCFVDGTTDLLDANWQESFSLRLAPGWPTGVYLAKLRDAVGKEAYVPFVVRDDRRRADLLVQLSVNTWQAYNIWGDHSLYGSFDANRRFLDTPWRGYKVSFNRPYDPTEDGLPGYGSGQLFRWEYNFVRWVESQGYNITYATNVDLHAQPGLLANRRGFISIGHDEYWSKEQRDHVEASRDGGIGLAFFGGNNVYWQIRYEPGAGGAENRTIVCYKDAGLDPLVAERPEMTTVRWADSPVNRPQSWLTGTIYGTNVTPEQQPWIIGDGSLWVFRDTGLETGDAVAGILGYEFERLAPADERPPGLQFSGSPVRGLEGWETAYTTVYVAASGAPVFNAGTIQWNWGLDDFGHEHIGAYADEEIQAVTRNALDAMIDRSRLPPSAN